MKTLQIKKITADHRNFIYVEKQFIITSSPSALFYTSIGFIKSTMNEIFKDLWMPYN